MEQQSNRQPTVEVTGTPPDVLEYLTDVIPACSPIEATDLDPCRPFDLPSHFGATGTVGGSGGVVSAQLPPPSIRELLDGESIIDVVHILVRGTFKTGSVRCTVGNIDRAEPWLDSEAGGLLLKCFADLQAREYILGTGPALLPVEVHHYHYGSLEVAERMYGRSVDDDTPTAKEAEEWIRRAMEKIVRGSEGFFTKEMIHALTPGYDHGVVNWKTWRRWGVERTDDDTIVVVHPLRKYYQEGWLAGYEQYKSSHLEIPLATFKTKVQAADQARRTEYGGRIVSTDHPRLKSGATPPMLQQDANKLDQYFRAAGAYSHPDGPPKDPPPPAGPVQ